MVKVISLSEVAYNLLKQHKKDNMSFSDVILENIDNSKNKTETINDLILWVKGTTPIKKKERISRNVDEIVYGIKR